MAMRMPFVVLSDLAFPPYGARRPTAQLTAPLLLLLIAKGRCGPRDGSSEALDQHARAVPMLTFEATSPPTLDLPRAHFRQIRFSSQAVILTESSALALPSETRANM